MGTIAYNPGNEGRCGQRRRRRLATIALVTAIVAAGCGDDDDGDTAGATTSGAATSATETDTAQSDDSTSAATTATPATTATTATFDPDGTFVYAQGNDLSRMDPHRGLGGPDGVMLFPAYDRLVHVAPSGEFIPGLAESWEYSDDGTVLTMKIRQGVTFHDGATLDANAVKANIEHAKAGTETDVARDLAPIEEVRVVDPATVELVLDSPNAAMVGILSDRAGIQISPQALSSGVNLDETMVGAGPFELVDYVPGSGAQYRRFEDYWGEPAKVANLEIRILPDPTARFNAVRSGDVDAAPIAASDIEAAEGAGLQVPMKTTVSYMNIYENRSHPALQDVRVREAILYAINREAICEAVLFGHCELTDQPFPPGYFANDGSGDQILYPYDPDKARALLEEAGVSDLSLDMIVAAGQADAQAIGEAVQAQLGEVGIAVNLVPTPPNEMAAAMFVDQSAPTLVSVWSGRPDPSTTLVQRATSTGFANPGGGTTPEAEELIAASVSTMDPTEREAALKAASRQVAEDVLESVLMFPQPAFATGPGVGFEPYVTAKSEFRNVTVGG